jgi:putative ABC transport system permease protein
MGRMLLHTLWQDLRYGVRTLRRNPGFAAIAVLTLGLGIGANTAIFSVVDAVLLRPLPYAAPDRLVFVWSTWISQGGGIGGSALPDYREWRARAKSLESLGGYTTSEMVLSGAELETERVPGVRITANLLGVLGITPARGRDFRGDEDRWGKHHVALLSHGLWQRRFGGDRQIVGRGITIGNEAFTVIGVLPEGLPLLANQPTPEIWVPLSYAPDDVMDSRSNHFVPLVGRLAPGATIEQAQAEITAIAQQLETQFPENKGLGGRVVAVHEELTRVVRPALLILVGAVGFVLLIACANLANLLYARAATRQRELAIRASLGAARTRLIRQLVIENLPIVVLGGAAALLIAWWSLRGMTTLLPPALPRVHAIALNARVFAFTAGLSLLTALLFSILPAWQAARRSVTEALNEGGRGGGEGLRHARVRAALIVAETAFALILLAGAGLMVRTFLKLRDVDGGFTREHVLTMRIPLPDWKYPESFNPGDRALPAGFAAFDTIVTRVRTLPGVQAAGFTTRLPLGYGGGWGKALSFEGEPRRASMAEVPSVRFGFLSPGYMEAVGIRLRQGRFFTDRDTNTGQPVALVNETFVRRFFPNQTPIGRWLMTRPPEYILRPPNPEDAGVHRTIVGVIADVKDSDFASDPRPEVYAPWTQTAAEGWNNALFLAIRTTTPPTSLIAAVRDQVRQVDAEQAITQIQPLTDIVDRRMSQPRFSTLLLGLFATVAVTLAAVGLFGLLSHLVTLRTHELGIRLALGAERHDVLRMVIAQGLKLAALGLAIGLGGALALGPVLRTQLFGIEPTDPATLGTVAGGLLLITLFACYLPARRATNVDPMIALRQQ